MKYQSFQQPTQLDGFRKCTKCEKVKPQAEFYGKTGRQQRNSSCIPCYRLQQNAARTIRRAVPGARKAEYLQGCNSPRARANALYWDIKKRCRARGIEFNLTKEWIIERLGTCAVTGAPLALCRNGTNKTHPFAPSVDRKDPSKGYTADNCQVVCWMYNAARNYHTHDDVVRFATYILAASQKPPLAEGSIRQ